MNFDIPKDYLQAYKSCSMTFGKTHNATAITSERLYYRLPPGYGRCTSLPGFSEN